MTTPSIIGFCTATTLKYNRYVVDEEKEREIVDKGYEDQQSLLAFAKKHQSNLYYLTTQKRWFWFTNETSFIILGGLGGSLYDLFLQVFRIYF